MNKKAVLITGASRGIGKAAALAFAAEGYNLILNARKSKDELETVKKIITSKTNSDCITVLADIGKEEDVKKLFAEAKSIYGGVDILVNNAGITHFGLLSEMSLEEWNHIIQTNLTSAFLCSKAAIPHMLKKQQGKILNISSVWGIIGASCETAYSASKGGMNLLTKALAKELAPSNIQVNAIACGVVETQMNHHLSAEEQCRLTEEIPAGRFATPPEVADFILQLAKANHYLTGQIIQMDGGWI